MLILYHRLRNKVLYFVLIFRMMLENRSFVWLIFPPLIISCASKANKAFMNFLRWFDYPVIIRLLILWKLFLISDQNIWNSELIFDKLILNKLTILVFVSRLRFLQSIELICMGLSRFLRRSVCERIIRSKVPPNVDVVRILVLLLFLELSILVYLASHIWEHRYVFLVEN